VVEERVVTEADLKWRAGQRGGAGSTPFNITADPGCVYLVQAARTALQRTMAEVDQMHSQLKSWSERHYGESMSAWMHIKIIRSFVEAVLRYGLPVKYQTVILK
jgi:hypothetical protein